MSLVISARWLTPRHRGSSALVIRPAYGGSPRGRLSTATIDERPPRSVRGRQDCAGVVFRHRAWVVLHVAVRLRQAGDGVEVFEGHPAVAEPHGKVDLFDQCADRACRIVGRADGFTEATQLIGHGEEV